MEKKIVSCWGVIVFTLAMVLSSCFSMSFYTKHAAEMDPVFGNIPEDQQAILFIGSFHVRNFAGKEVDWNGSSISSPNILKIPSGSHTIIFYPGNLPENPSNRISLSENFQAGHVYELQERTKDSTRTKSTIEVTIKDITPKEK